jgi:CubicO group peptidase (beta-lactamase class C family)
MRQTLIVLIILLAGCGRLPTPRGIDPSCPATRCDWSSLDQLVDSATEHGAVPGAVVGISRRGSRYIHGSGVLGLGQPGRPDARSIYDLASLTKVIALTTGIMLAVDEGLLDLDRPLQQYLAAFTGEHKDRVTLRHLLTHTSGLPPHRRLWEETRSRPEALVAVGRTPLDTTPGSRMAYSDLGAILLTQALERVTGTRIDSWLTTRVFRPLGMMDTGWLPPHRWRDRIAPSERDSWRARMVRGEVHDENAAWLDGVSGHAGLFGSATDLLTFGEWLLSGLNENGTPAPSRFPFPPPRSLRAFIERQNIVVGSSRALGWDTPSPGSSAGDRLAPSSFGHTGFTGTSIWIDPSRQLVIVVLTNRVHPTRENTAHAPLRRAVADRIVDLLEPRQPE